MSSQNGLIVKNDTEEEDKPNERNPILDWSYFGHSEIIPDQELQTDTKHTNIHEPLFVKAGRSVIIDVEIFHKDSDVVIFVDGKVRLLVVPDCVMVMPLGIRMRLDRKKADVLRVSIYNVMDFVGKTFIFKQEEHASIPFTIHESTKANDPDYSKTNEHHMSLLECCCLCIWYYRQQKVKPMRERNQVFLFDDQSNVRRLKETKGDHKPGDENKPHNENKPDDENKPEEEKTKTSDPGPKIICVTTVPKGPGPKRL